MTLHREDTIAAIATPPGRGALGIVRLSGREALSVADRLFSSSAGAPSGFASHTVHYGFVRDGDTLLDNVLLTVMRAPATYTGEDVVEISCHGAPLVLRRVLHAALRSGARPAEPGEFTLRAFLNRKMDLAQAEAVQRLIAAESEAAMRLAVRHLAGDLSRAIEGFRSRLIAIAAEVEAAIDFPDEDIAPATAAELLERLSALADAVGRLRLSYTAGSRLCEGVRVVIVGKPNVGKSSLLNALAGEDRAIVTPQPGTTRDTVEGALIVNGLAFTLVDTAGLGLPSGPVEQEGMRRSHAAAEAADLVLFVLDGAAGVTDEDARIHRSFAARRFLIVINKIDLPQRLTEQEARALFPGAAVLRVSALTRQNLDELKRALRDAVLGGQEPSVEGILIASARHHAALERTGAALTQAMDGLRMGRSPDLVSIDLREALDALGGIVGLTTTEDILAEIFSKFCIGK